MTIPVDVQARIDAIVGRFQPSTADTSGASSSTSATDFSSVLSDAMRTSASSATSALGLGTTGAGGTTDVAVNSSDPLVGMAQILLDASAARSAGLTGRVASGGVASVGSVGSAYSSMSSPTIATKQSVTNLEGLYDNGRLPDEALTSIGVGSHRLSAPAASAFRKMIAAAEAEGVTIGVTDSYRSYDAQVDVARRKGLYSQGGLAAKPGTSDHGLGLALDLDLDSTAQAWMRANGTRFGFVEDTPREPWHWKFAGV